MATFRLLWKDRDLGEVSNLFGEFPWMSATFRPGRGLNKQFRKLFAFLAAEPPPAQDPPFAEDLLSDDHWWLVDDAEKRWGISLPAVFLDEGSISWRWRGEAPRW
jgi:hypothetical protein